MAEAKLNKEHTPAVAKRKAPEPVSEESEVQSPGIKRFKPTQVEATPTEQNEPTTTRTTPQLAQVTMAKAVEETKVPSPKAQSPVLTPKQQQPSALRSEAQYYEDLEEFQAHFHKYNSALVWLVNAQPTRSWKLAIPKSCRWPKSTAGKDGYASAFRKMGLYLRPSDTKSGHWHYWYVNPDTVDMKALQRALLRRWRQAPNYHEQKTRLAALERPAPVVPNVATYMPANAQFGFNPAMFGMPGMMNPYGMGMMPYMPMMQPMQAAAGVHASVPQMSSAMSGIPMQQLSPMMFMTPQHMASIPTLSSAQLPPSVQQKMTQAHTMMAQQMQPQPMSAPPASTQIMSSSTLPSASAPMQQSKGSQLAAPAKLFQSRPALHQSFSRPA